MDSEEFSSVQMHCGEDATSRFYDHWTNGASRSRFAKTAVFENEAVRVHRGGQAETKVRFRVSGPADLGLRQGAGEANHQL